MADIQYEFVSVPPVAEIHVARLAVLYPLVVRAKNVTAEELIEAAFRLLKMWRGRLAAFREAGYAKLQNDDNYFMARNCWPEMFGMPHIYRGQARRCKLAACPWCYARKVRRLFRAIYDNMRKFKCKILASCHQKHISIVDFDSNPNIYKYQDDAVRRIRSLIPRNRTDKPLGAHWEALIEPSPEELYLDMWRVTLRCIMLLRHDQDVDNFPVTHVGYPHEIFHDTLRVSDIVEAVGRIYRYPTGLMHESPDLAVAALIARENQRLSNYLGCFRGSFDPPKH